MATPNEKLIDQVMRQGNVIYIYDPSGKHSYPWKGNTAGVAVIGIANTAGVINALLGDTSGLCGRTHLVFYPGRAVLSGGMVESGTRSDSGTITTGASADVTYWGTEIMYSPKELGIMDGGPDLGIFKGQITIGLEAAAGTVLGKVTARIRSNSTASPANTGPWVTCLTLTGTAIACSTARTYKTYDLPYLMSSSSCERLPFGFAIGVQTAIAATAVIGRIMESSYIEFDIIPGT